MNRRTDRGYRLRIYMDAIKEVEAMPIEKWIEMQASIVSTEPYMSKDAWLAQLKKWALEEAERALIRRAA